MSYQGVMAHLISHYPDAEAFWEVASGIVDGGAAAVELQFPFSDPTADGPAIQNASSVALKAGFTLAAGFDFLRRLRSMTDRPIFLMTYANVPMVRGVDRFVGEAAEAGARGLIVPDLPPGDDEGLYAAGATSGVAVVPVVVPSLSDARRRLIEEVKPEYLYVALRRGTTGRETEIGPDQIEFLDWAREKAGKLMGGFGIRRREQIDVLKTHLDLAVVGSAIVNVIDGTREGIRERVTTFVRGLTEEPHSTDTLPRRSG
ncbi:MAG: tryptophan synthase subunit alpha [Spirochaetota bacterium]